MKIVKFGALTAFVALAMTASHGACALPNARALKTVGKALANKSFSLVKEYPAQSASYGALAAFTALSLCAPHALKIENSFRLSPEGAILNLISEHPKKIMAGLWFVAIFHEKIGIFARSVLRSLRQAANFMFNGASSAYKMYKEEVKNNKIKKDLMEPQDDKDDINEYIIDFKN